MIIRRAAVILLVLAAASLAGVAGPVRDNDPAALSGLAGRLPTRLVDPLAPFHLSLDIAKADLARLATIGDRERLKSGPDTYEHLSLAGPGGDARALPAPSGMTVVAGDFYFKGGERLVEASLLLRTDAGTESAIGALERELGVPVFEVVLPGALDLVLGWRTGDGFVLASFTDLDVFRVSAFRGDEEDLVSGSQIVLFEGLADYAKRLAGGTSADELVHELMKVVTWVAVARGRLEPAN